MGFTYLDLDGFQLRTIMPAVDVSAIEADTPGWFVAKLTTNSARLNARLKKRYAVPFQQVEGAYPEAILDWLTRITEFEGYIKRGFDPQDQSIAHIKARYDTALAEVKEAADGEAGLFDLPVADASTPDQASAVANGFPQAYSEQSPYTWQDRERAAAREEDRDR